MTPEEALSKVIACLEQAEKIASHNDNRWTMDYSSHVQSWLDIAEFWSRLRDAQQGQVRSL